MSTEDTTALSVSALRRISRFFYMYIGSFIGVFVYFGIAGKAQYTAAGVEHALIVGLVLHSAYLLVAYSSGELKHFDFGLWALFAVGVLAFHIGTAGTPVARLAFEHYSPALVPGTLGITALVPLLLNRETFTFYFARRQTPRWQQKLPVFGAINRLMTAFWVVIFFVAAGLSAWAPADWRFTALYPNLVIFGVGMIGGSWIPSLYLKLFPPAPPEDVEALIMGMPFAFDRRAAGDARAVIQFRVSGREPGDYYLRIERGTCRSFEGLAVAPDLTIRTPTDVWRRVVYGGLDGTHALEEGLYEAEGKLEVLAGLRNWFSRGG